MTIFKKKVEVIDLDVGDIVELYPNGELVRIKRLVENENGTYAVFDNDTWRHTNNYGYTWWKRYK